MSHLFGDHGNWEAEGDSFLHFDMAGATLHEGQPLPSQSNPKPNAVTKSPSAINGREFTPLSGTKQFSIKQSTLPVRVRREQLEREAVTLSKRLSTAHTLIGNPPDEYAVLVGEYRMLSAAHHIVQQMYKEGTSFIYNQPSDTQELLIGLFLAPFPGIQQFVEGPHTPGDLLAAANSALQELNALVEGAREMVDGSTSRASSRQSAKSQHLSTSSSANLPPPVNSTVNFPNHFYAIQQNPISTGVSVSRPIMTTTIASAMVPHFHQYQPKPQTRFSPISPFQSTFGTAKLQPPSFSGDPKEWLSFWTYFERAIDALPIPGFEKHLHLLRSLKEGSPPRREIEAYAPSDENYPIVVRILKERFGNTEDLQRAMRAALLHMPPAQDSTASLCHTVDEFERLLRHLEQLGVNINDGFFRIVLESKLTLRVLTQMKLEEASSGGKWSILKFRTAVVDYCRCLRAAESALISMQPEPVPTQIREEAQSPAVTNAYLVHQTTDNNQELDPSFSTGEEPDNFQFQPVLSLFPVQQMTEREPVLIASVPGLRQTFRPPLCSFCNLEGHLPSKCPTYDSAKKLRQRAADLQRCLVCLAHGHMAIDCHRQKNCRNCGSCHHHSLLCIKPNIKGCRDSLRSGKPATMTFSPRPVHPASNAIRQAGRIALKRPSRTRPMSCSFCGFDGHLPSWCPIYNSTHKLRQKAAEQQRCLICLAYGHTANNCIRRKNCQKCGTFNHHSLLCSNPAPENNRDNQKITMRTAMQKADSIKMAVEKSSDFSLVKNQQSARQEPTSSGLGAQPPSLIKLCSTPDQLKSVESGPVSSSTKRQKLSPIPRKPAETRPVPSGCPKPSPILLKPVQSPVPSAIVRPQTLSSHLKPAQTGPLSPNARQLSPPFHPIHLKPAESGPDYSVVTQHSSGMSKPTTTVVERQPIQPKSAFPVLSLLIGLTQAVLSSAAGLHLNQL